MSVPGEDYVLRLRWPSPDSLRINVLDLVTASGDEPVALIEWESGSKGVLAQAGFSVIRFRADGSIKWQVTHVLCRPGARDCGRWVMTNGAITMSDDGFIVAATIINADTEAVQMIGIGIPDGGPIASWIRNYQTTKGVARAMGIVRLATPNLFLVSAHNVLETDTWLFGIDNNGFLTGLEMRFIGRIVQRLRLVPSQGIFALGTNNFDGHGWMLNLDTSAKPAWERLYDPMDGSPLRWFDIARGNGVLTAIGNAGAGPVVAKLADNSGPDFGDARQTFRLRAEGAFLRINGIASLSTTSSICGDFAGAAWHFAIDDAMRFLWQKKYDHGTSVGSLTPILFPSGDTNIVGGFTTVTGDPTRGLLVRSRVASGPAPLACGEETNAAFVASDLATAVTTSAIKPLALRSFDWQLDQAPMLELTPGCLP